MEKENDREEGAQDERRAETKVDDKSDESFPPPSQLDASGANFVRYFIWRRCENLFP